jgi:hypothetical protein
MYRITDKFAPRPNNDSDIPHALSDEAAMLKIKARARRVHPEKPCRSVDGNWRSKFPNV